MTQPRASEPETHLPQPATASAGSAFLPIPLLPLALICLTAFAIYWSTSFLVMSRNISNLFGADTWFYTELADGNIFARIADDYFLDRIFRFRPLTVLMAAFWQSVFLPLSSWIDPLYALRAMFAATGVAGVWAAISAFAVLIPRLQAALWGIVYAASLHVWFFSSIEESKIVTTTLATIYVALYLRMRGNESTRNITLLGAVLFAACMNEIVAAFMVAVPALDTLLRKGLRYRELRWIFLHALLAPLAYLVTRLLIFFFTNPATPHSEGANHLDTLWWYVQQNTFTFEAVHAFAVRWLFFGIAAPEANVYYANPSFNYGGDFYPALWIYLFNPVPAAAALLALVIFAACFWRESGVEGERLTPLMLGLAAYAAVRGIFFFLFIPKEYLLYTGSVTLAHLLLIAVPFARSKLPGKVYFIAAFAALVAIDNGLFLMTVQVHPD